MQKKIQNIESVWITFKENEELKVKHQIMLHYIWLIKYAIQQMNIPPHPVLTDEDFVNIGFLGLNEAIDRFELSRGVKFESYAINRIKGIIQDELRKLDFLSRTARKKASEIMQITDELRSQKGREVSSEEVRQKLNLSPEKYKSYLQAAAAAKASISMNENSSSFTIFEDEEINLLEEFADPEQTNYLDNVEAEERLIFLTDYITSLAEKKRLVLTLYYYENLTFKEIGNVLNVSESRICQIHTQVVGDLKVKLVEFENA